MLYRRSDTSSNRPRPVSVMKVRGRRGRWLEETGEERLYVLSGDQ